MSPLSFGSTESVTQSARAESMRDGPPSPGAGIRKGAQGAITAVTDRAPTSPAALPEHTGVGMGTAGSNFLARANAPRSY